MIRITHHLGAASDALLRLRFAVGFAGLRYGSVLGALPLCSSLCFFAFRFALAVLGGPV
jgi:hypothetical protein